MTSVQIPTNITPSEQQAQQYFIKGNYTQAASCYEQAIETEPEVKSHYWNLGLMLLLQGQEAEAQMTWLLGMEEGEAEQVEQWTVELIKVLQTEAERRETLADYSVAWAIRQHIREISPIYVNNLLYLIELSIKLRTFTGDELTSLEVIELIQSEAIIDIELLLQVLGSIINDDPLHPSVLEFVECCLTHINEPQSFINILLPAAVKIIYSMRQAKVAISLVELCLRLEPENTELLRHLAAFYIRDYNYYQGIEIAKLCYSLSKSLTEKIFAKHLIQRGLMECTGYWNEACTVFLEQEFLINSLIEEQPINVESASVLRLFNANYYAPYLQDNPHKNRQVQNQLAQLCQLNVQEYATEKLQRYKQRSSHNINKKIKIGYLSHCLSRHSVGWLARWLIQHHTREQFDIYGYFINYKQVDDSLQEWYIQQFNQAYLGGLYSDDIAEKISEDEIDILIDLDSITLDITCEIMALKPAPVQVTWLGWDASGIPAVDYFIADPYVLPDSAQEYYTEKSGDYRKLI